MTLKVNKYETFVYMSGLNQVSRCKRCPRPWSRPKYQILVRLKKVVSVHIKLNQFFKAGSDFLSFPRTLVGVVWESNAAISIERQQYYTLH